jgi:4-amino-4-deoxy-L-arabinose transferase-like glycosyltransferase
MVAVLALVISLCALAYCLPRGLVLLYGDAVAHLHIARRMTDSLNPGFRQLGSVWLPLPHLLLLPFVQKMSWWQSGLAGAPPSMIAFVLGAAGLYRLARYWLSSTGATIAAVFYSLNPGLVYLQTTAMNEPLFLAEMIWAAVLLTGYQRLVSRVAVANTGKLEAAPIVTAEDRRVRRLLLGLGLVLAAAVFTRYDGWIFSAVAWCFAAHVAYRSAGLRRAWGGAFLLFTAIVLAAPLFWMSYNAKQFHDPLDFLRGPYSARAIELKTTPPGASPYPGWHNIRIAGHYFLKTAELGAASKHVTNVLLLLALLGAGAALVRRQARAVLVLLWLPLPFYAYSIAYGSVPIFIPPWPPYSYYNTRYGMELLPAFALSLAFAADTAASWMERREVRWIPYAVAAVLVLIGVNDWLLMRARPLVLEEALANSRTRLPFEGALARALAALPPQGRILMYTSDHIGAVQQAGIPLVRTINDTDDKIWIAALKNPEAAAPFAVAIDGDALAKAIAAHPGGLTLLDLICSTGQPCARVYAATAAIGGVHSSDASGSITHQ